MLRLLLQLVLVVVILGGSAFAVKVLIDSREKPAFEPPVIPPPLVEVIEVEVVNHQVMIPSQGSVVPFVESELIPEVAGRVTWISDSLVSGGFFREGDPLLRIDPRDFELAVTMAESEVAMRQRVVVEEKAEADVAQKEWSSLGEGEGSELALRTYHVKEAEANLKSAEASSLRAKLDLERTEVVAPYNGRVRSESLGLGQFVNRGNPIAQLYATDFAEIRLPLSDDEFSFVESPDALLSTSSEGAPKVTLTAQFGRRDYSWEGTLVRTEGEIDPQTRQIHVIARVANPYEISSDSERPPLTVGLYVKAKIQGKSLSDVVILPRAALWRQGKVLVIDSEDEVTIVDVTVLRSGREEVLIEKGLEVGQRVCLTSLSAVVEGMKVRVLPSSDEEGGSPQSSADSALPTESH